MRQKATYAVDDLATMRITLIDYVAVHWPADDPTRTRSRHCSDARRIGSAQIDVDEPHGGITPIGAGSRSMGSRRREYVACDACESKRHRFVLWVTSRTVGGDVFGRKGGDEITKSFDEQRRPLTLLSIVIAGLSWATSVRSTPHLPMSANRSRDRADRQGRPFQDPAYPPFYSVRQEGGRSLRGAIEIHHCTPVLLPRKSR